MSCRLQWIALIVLPLFLRTADGAFVPSVVAAAGFNDAAGINQNQPIDSPYVLNDSLPGRGAGEPGWARTWTGSLNRQLVTSESVHEGDGAARFLSDSTALSRGLTTAQSGPFVVDQYVRAPAGGFGAFFLAREANSGAIATQGPFWRWDTNGNVAVLDGEFNSCTSNCIIEDTGFNWTPDTWHRVTLYVDASADRRDYVFFFDGQPYLSNDRLQFRGNPTDMDRVGYIVDRGSGFFVDALEIRAFAEPQLLGDTDGNGKVDVADLNNVRNQFGQTGLFLAGDAYPFDGRVDVRDLNLVRNSFGQTSLVAVPEPAGFALATIPLLIISLRRRCRSYFS
jgi:hypothetical protein